MNHKTPVICLTADAVQGARDRYLEEGFTDYLSKPVESAALEQKLMRYLPQDKVIRMSTQDMADKTPATDTARNAAADGVPAKEAPAKVSSLDAHPLLDLNAARTYLVTDELIEKTIRQFAESCGEKADEIERLLAAEDYENYTIKVHALKSSARLIGADALSRAAEYLEMCGNAVRESDSGNQ